jgi:hypothetical protein
MRVNARLDSQTEQQLRFVVEETGMGVSDTLKAAIASYYEKLRADKAPQLNHLRRFMVSHGSGRNDVASRTRELYAEAVSEKLGVGVREPERKRNRRKVTPK